MFGKKTEPKNQDNIIVEWIQNIFPMIKDYASEFIDDIKDYVHNQNLNIDLDNGIDNIKEFCLQKLEEWKTQLPEKYNQLKQGIDEIGGFSQFLKMCWQLETKTTDQFTFEELISWAKTYLNPEKHSAACLYVVKNASPYEYHVCFLDKNNNPLLNSLDKHLVVYTKSIDKDLVDALGDKNMLVLK